MADGEQNASGEVAPGESGPIAVGSTEPTEEQRAYWDEQARIGEHIESHRAHLATLVEHAHTAGHALYASWPDLDRSTVHSLSGELQLIAGEAASARAGLSDWTASYRGFTTIGHWASHAAGICGGLMDVGDQERHAALSDLLHALDNMQAGLGEM